MLTASRTSKRATSHILSRSKPPTTSFLRSRASASSPSVARHQVHHHYPTFLSSSRGFASDASSSLLPREDRKPHFDKILVANRGEIACRVIRTCKKLGIKTVAVYSDVDADSLHVKMADEAWCIGHAPSSESYLRMDKIIEVCKATGAQVYGFLSENADFATLLASSGITFIGPPASAISSMGSKSKSKTIMLDAGVPCIPGYHGSNQDPTLLFSQAREMGFPVLIKATHGGGGKGQRVVSEDSESVFMDALDSAKRESLKSFGNDEVLIEKFITNPRHIEVQIFGDESGDVVGLWERDCSVQRRGQKIIEEAPAPGLEESVRKELSEKAVAAAKAVGYVGAGTVEFIFDNDTGEFLFHGDVIEHPVTEMITGLDLVDWQLSVAAGNRIPLSQAQIPLVGHSFEARIYAENPRNNFMPDSGSLVHLSTPAATTTFALPLSPSARLDSAALIATPVTNAQIAPSVRIEQGFGAGSLIGVYYDPMIAKLVVHGNDRTEALRVLRKALEEYQVVGVETNIEFLRVLAGNEAFVRGDVGVGFIKEHFDELFQPVPKLSATVLAQAALFVVLRAQPKVDAVASQTPWTLLASRRFGGDVSERVVKLRIDENTEAAVHILSLGVPGMYDVRVVIGEDEVASFVNVKAELAPTGGRLFVELNSERFSTTVVPQLPPSTSSSSQIMERLHIFQPNGVKTILAVSPPNWLSSIAGEVAGAVKGALKAPMPSLVVDVKVNVGDEVSEGQAVVVLESMKTESVVRANVGGVVKAVGCKKGDMIEEGREMVFIEEKE
ncbi:carbamoyl-phosphate synthase L chain, ATP binding domain-containing protein [Flagelloscypha sp. PMI_526]|nr:carbamoyl-phosphate synthase L chain, ATP binding domain-containing protein [Flagelloscypha sp. PMI_526]